MHCDEYIILTSGKFFLQDIADLIKSIETMGKNAHAFNNSSVLMFCFLSRFDI